MKQEIYTVMPTPFAIARLSTNVKTEVEEYEVIKLSSKYSGILIKNTVRNIWHLAEKSSGAIVGTHESKAKLIKQVKKDIRKGSEDVMAKQVEQGKIDCERASFMSNCKFFATFK